MLEAVSLMLSPWLLDRIRERTPEDGTQSDTIRQLLVQVKDAIEIGERLPNVHVQGWTDLYPVKLDAELRNWVEDQRGGRSMVETMNELLTIAVEMPPAEKAQTAEELYKYLQSVFPAWERVGLYEVKDAVSRVVGWKVARSMLLELAQADRLWLQQIKGATAMSFPKADKSGRLKYSHLTLLSEKRLSFNQLHRMASTGKGWEDVREGSEYAVFYNSRPIAILSVVTGDVPSDWKDIDLSVGNRNQWSRLQIALTEIKSSSTGFIFSVSGSRFCLKPIRN